MAITKKAPAKRKATAEQPTPPPKPKAYKVAPGCAITCKRALKTEGDVITPDDIEGGAASIKAALSAGLIE